MKPNNSEDLVFLGSEIVNEREISLDDRRRASLGRIGQQDHERYHVTEMKNGTLIFTPLSSISLIDLAKAERLETENSRDEMARAKASRSKRKNFEYL